MVVVRSPVRSCVRSVVRDVFGVVDGQTDLQRILALSPSLLIWPAQGAGWQGTSVTVSARAESGLSLGTGADLSQLGGKTLDDWIASPTTSSQIPNGSIAIVGTATAATYNTATGEGSVSRVDVSNQSSVQWTSLGSQPFYMVVECLTGSLLVRSGTIAGTSFAIAGGVSSPILVTPTTGQVTITNTTAAGTSTFIVRQFNQLPGNHLRAGTWASPSDAARANYVIDTNPALYDVSGQPELVTNGDFSDGTTGWTAGNSATLSASSGVFRVENGAANFGTGSQQVTVVAGRAYVATYTTAGGTSGFTLRFGSSAAGTQYASISATGAGQVIFTAANTTLFITAANSSATLGLFSEYDNISVKELPVSQYKYALSFGGVDDYYSLLNAISITTDMTVVRAFKRSAAGIKSLGIASATATEPHDGIWWSDNKSYLRMSAGTQIATAGTDTATGSFVHTSRRNVSTQTLRRNGTEILTGLSGVLNLAFSTVGRYETGAANYNSGEISFLAVFPTELTGANLALVEQIAAATNGATLA